MKVIIDIPDENYNHIITEGYRATIDGKVVYRAILDGIPLNDDDRLLSESEIISALETMKKQFEASNEWNRVYGMMVAKNVVKGCPDITKD